MDLLCKWCSEAKPEESFIKRNTKLPYSQSNVRSCRDCNAARNRQRYKRPEIKAAMSRASANWRRANRERVAASEGRYAIKYPSPAKARARVRHLLRRGYWTKQPCVVCGHSAYVEAHHDSYAPAHWETVRWMCKDHHEAWHQILDPMKKSVIGGRLESAATARAEAQGIMDQIKKLRADAAAKTSYADFIEFEAWTDVMKQAEPMFAGFLDQ